MRVEPTMVDRFRRHLARVAARSVVPVLGLAALWGCDLNPNVEACSVSVAPSNITVPVNSSLTISGTAFDCSGNSIKSKTINFSSANTAVATVTTSGQVIGVSVGQTTIAGVANGQQGTAQVTVTPELPTTVTVSPATLTLRLTNQKQLTATAKNAQGTAITGRTFRWSSSNSSIASVDQAGNVTALAAGNVIIAADADGILGNAAITVTNIPVGSCTLAPTTQKLTVSAQVQPTITLRDTAGNALPTQGRALAWASDNEVIATVSTSGVISAKKAGTARITVSSVEYPNVSCSTAVEAVDPRIVSAVVSPRTATLRLGVPRQFQVALYDSLGQTIPAGRVITWSSVTPTTASVSATGLVTGLSLGAARIAINAEGVRDTVSLTVTKVPVATVRLSPLASSTVQGQTVQFTATIEDSTGTVATDRVVEWTTSDPTKATVSATGLVTTAAPGTVTVSATSETKVGSATVTILQVPVDSILVASSYSVALTANSKAFAITLKDAAGNQLLNRGVSISSSAPDIAVGSANSSATLVTVTANVAGTATFTLRALNQSGQPEGKSSQITVTITP